MSIMSKKKSIDVFFHCLTVTITAFHARTDFPVAYCKTFQELHYWPLSIKFLGVKESNHPHEMVSKEVRPEKPLD